MIVLKRGISIQYSVFSIQYSVFRGQWVSLLLHLYNKFRVRVMKYHTSFFFMNARILRRLNLKHNTRNRLFSIIHKPTISYITTSLHHYITTSLHHDIKTYTSTVLLIPFLPVHLSDQKSFQRDLD